MTSITDHRGQVLNFDKPPQRVVSLIPSITETLFELGVGDRVAGISKYCIHPEASVKSKPKVGGQKNPDFEIIESLDPDLVILNEEENKPEHIDLFMKKYRTFVTYPRIFTDSEKLLLELGNIFGVEDKAGRFAESIRKDGEKLSKPAVHSLRAIYLIWRNPWMSINSDTYIHDVMEKHGLMNVFAKRKERYFEVTAGDIEKAAPDVILMPDEPYHFLEKHKSEFSLITAPAVKNSNLILCDGTYFCWYGTRAARASRYITDEVISRLKY